MGRMGKRPDGLAGVAENDFIGVPVQVCSVNVSGTELTVENVSHWIARLEPGFDAQVPAGFVAVRVLRPRYVAKPMVGIPFRKEDFRKVQSRVRQYDFSGLLSEFAEQLTSGKHVVTFFNRFVSVQSGLHILLRLNLPVGNGLIEDFFVDSLRSMKVLVSR